MSKMKIPVEIAENQILTLEVEFSVYRDDEFGPNFFDILGWTPDVILTESQEAQIIEYLQENYEPTVDADR